MDLVISLHVSSQRSMMHIKYNDKKWKNGIWPLDHFGKGSERWWSTKTQGTSMEEARVTWRTLQLRGNQYRLSLIWLVLRDDGHGMSSCPKVVYFKGKVKNVKHMLKTKVKSKSDHVWVHDVACSLHIFICPSVLWMFTLCSDMYV